MSQDEIWAEHDRLYKAASALVTPLLEVHGRAIARLEPGQEAELRHGLALFDMVLKIRPSNWAAMWLAGKACQRLHDYDGALSWFASAHELNPSQPDVAREASIAAMHVGRPIDAITFCQRAIEAKPQDAGLRANLALATLFSDDAKKAKLLAEDALNRDPADPITAKIVEVCSEVLAGVRKCPNHIRDIIA